jgi:hypothetical protein
VAGVESDSIGGAVSAKAERKLQQVWLPRRDGSLHEEARET